MGQLANQAAVELTQEGFGKMFCLAGVGGHLGGFVQSAKDVPEMVAIDGCDIGCANAILEHADVPLQGHLIITDLGIEKNKDFDLKRPDIKRVKEPVREAAANGNASTEQSRNPVQGCSCCG